MKKRVLITFVIMTIVTMGLMACGNGEGSHSGTDEMVLNTGEDFTKIIDPDNEVATVEVTFTVPGEEVCPVGMICPASVVPGAVNPFEMFGSMIGQINLGDRSLYDPWNNAIDYSWAVVAGQFSATFNIPVGVTWHLGYSTNGKMAAHNITIGGTTMQYACILGTAPYTWGVVSFIVNRDETGAVTVTENPYCTAIPVVLGLTRSGDSQTALYDDNPFLPYDGVSEGPMVLQSTATTWATPQTMATFVAGTGWVEDFYGYATAATDPVLWAGWFSVYQDAVRRTAVPPVNPEEPGLGGLYLNVYNAAGTVALCTAPANTELHHWQDYDPAATNWYAAVIDRIDSASSCPVQQAENRFSVQ